MGNGIFRAVPGRALQQLTPTIGRGNHFLDDDRLKSRLSSEHQLNNLDFAELAEATLGSSEINRSGAFRMNKRQTFY